MTSIHTTVEPGVPAASSLRPLLARACARARQAGEPVLATTTFALPAAPVLATARHLSAPDTFSFYWERSADGMALAGGGAARVFTAEGAGRFGALAEAVQAALEGAETDGTVSGGADAGGPHAVGGFSFFPELDAAEWPGFGPARLVVPAWLLRHTASGTHGVVTVAAGPGDDPDALAERMAATAAAVQAAAAHGPDEPAGTGHNYAFHREAREDEREHWLRVVRETREAIRAGHLAKVVLARALDLVCEEAPSPFDLLARLRASYPECYTFLVAPGAGQAFLGASPERLARFDGPRVHLAALAGTAGRDARPEVDAALAEHLLASAKERSEHDIVVEGVLAAVAGLGRVSRPEAPAVLKLPNLQHLYTPITLEPTQPMAPLHLLERLHPTAAVGGHPRDEAFRLIREREHFDRGWYGAPVGWLNAAGEGEFAVALRSGTVRENRVRLFAGGGIVADSDPEREFEETRIKFQALLTALGHE